MRVLAALLIIGCLAVAPARAEDPWSFGGRSVYQFLYANYPDDSLFNELIGEHVVDHAGELRMKLGWRKEAWEARADYQLIGRYGDSLASSRVIEGLTPFPGQHIDDDRRLFDLTHTITEGDDYLLVQRLDRLYVGYTGKQAVVRVGRQALSWGNGLVYTPMDFFNPFDPTAVDREYKTGDDMAYGQYLFGNGDDLQGVWVGRREPVSGDVSSDVNSVAFKYHGFLGGSEYDVLASQHYGDWILAAGGIQSVGGAILRGDFTVTKTDDDTVLSLVTNATYSWMGWGKNMSGVLELYYNGFGLSGDEYSVEDLIENPDLAKRLERGELFTLGQYYVAGSVLVELMPLWSLTPNVFLNAGDGSGLFQLVSQYDFAQNWQMLAAVGLPFGPDGSEYGGIDSGIDGLNLSSTASLFVQLAWYF